MFRRLRLWLAPHRFLIIRLFWLSQLLIGLTVVVCLIFPPLGVYWPKFGRLFANLSVIFFCLTILPGILKRFQATGFLQDIQLLLLIFRRQLGITMYMFALYHYLFSRLLPTYQYHGNFFVLSPFELVGMAAFLLTLPLFLTSNNWSQAKLGRNWRRLHRLVYLIIWITLTHVILQLKFGPVTLLLALTAIMEITSFFKGILAAILASVLTLALVYFSYALKNPQINVPTSVANVDTGTPSAQAIAVSPYSLEAVASHRTATDCWLVINGKVYNVTAYVPFHPGGQETIISSCGTDATVSFNSKGGRGRAHLPATSSVLVQYYLADLNAPTASASAVPAVPTGLSGFPLTPSSTITPTKTTVPSSTTLTSAEVQKHNTQSNCWIIVSGKVYNVTAYIPFHPGGTQQIVNTCGSDATTAFNTRGGTGSHSSTAQSLLANYLIGSLGSSASTTNPPAANSGSLQVPPTSAPPPSAPLPTTNPSLTLNSTEVAKHSSQSDCWIIVSGKVYNVTAYIPFHPGGTQQIVNTCGSDATTAFNTRGGTGSHSTNAQNLLSNYYLGDFNGTTSGGGSSTSPTNTPAPGGQASSPQAAILAAYPGATIKEVDSEDWGYQVHFVYQGHEYEAKLNQSYVITSVK